MAHEFVKLGVKPNPTLRLVTQAIVGVAPGWSELEPQLGESQHLKVCLEGDVTLPHFSDVNILVDVILEWPPLTLPPTSLSWANSEISYILIKRTHSHYVFVFLVEEVLLGVSFIFT